jgi:hypothetical protein
VRKFADPVIVGEVIGKDWDPIKGFGTDPQ